MTTCKIIFQTLAIVALVIAFFTFAAFAGTIAIGLAAISVIGFFVYVVVKDYHESQ